MIECCSVECFNKNIHERIKPLIKPNISSVTFETVKEEAFGACSLGFEILSVERLTVLNHFGTV